MASWPSLASFRQSIAGVLARDPNNATSSRNFIHRVDALLPVSNEEASGRIGGDTYRLSSFHEAQDLAATIECYGFLTHWMAGDKENFSFEEHIAYLKNQVNPVPSEFRNSSRIMGFYETLLSPAQQEERNVVDFIFSRGWLLGCIEFNMPDAIARSLERQLDAVILHAFIVNDPLLVPKAYKDTLRDIADGGEILDVFSRVVKDNDPKLYHQLSRLGFYEAGNSKKMERMLRGWIEDEAKAAELIEELFKYKTYILENFDEDKYLRPCESLSLLLNEIPQLNSRWNRVVVSGENLIKWWVK